MLFVTFCCDLFVYYLCLFRLYLIEDSLPVAGDIPDTIPVSTSTDWQAAFGFTSTQTDAHDDDLGKGFIRQV